MVIAHPDDEVMFFAPSVWSLVDGGRHVTLYCIGDSSEVRMKELHSSVKYLGIHSLKWARSGFIDSMSVEWNVNSIAALVEQECNRHAYKAIITFDDYGVSGHTNHIQCAKACKLVWEKRKSFNLLQLRSVPVWRKYLSWIDSFATMVLSVRDGDDSVSFQAREWFAWLRLWRHMATCYPSQFVWYRKAYVLFTRYAYQNDYSVFAKK